ncbi:Serine/threonine-protein kinase gad8 [Penicillium cosmopolitanum]|uniref:non-specific serine/threonine protein kinase n=1 Tax=Penicillium cosmopolitanum TaxID=1131564 RepID=A0A9W9W865_9EURO|nr:Serine/threonine-protein kinase gad8 [Penicillium cosmopolitanum]KAJ5408079.1 Serine/threonine-protein kinase gad8 [Penicillium cosmopolitanum]
MSWKLTKKLKETHLAPLTQGFGRSSSTSTIKGDSNGGGGDETPVTPQAPSIAATPSNTANGIEERSPTDCVPDAATIANSEFLVSPPVNPVNPGILIVTLHEGRGFALSPHFQQIFNSHFQNNSYAPSSLRPSTSSSSHSSHGQAGSFSMAVIRLNTSPYALLDFEKNQVFVDAVSGSPENPLWAGDNTAFKFDVSRKTELNVQLYLRNPAARPGAGRSEDIFLGATKVTPRFEEATQPFVEDPKLSKKDNQKAAAAHAEQERASGQQGAEWLDLQFGNGSIKVGVSFVENRQRSLKMEDFDLLKVVGKGSFGKVMQVMKKDTGRIYALKTIRKAHIISRSEVTHTLAERSVLAQINNPFIVPLKFSFQSPEKLYFVLAFVNGGELFHHLQREQRFDINRARFYTAELLCALECLHGFKVIYRDLKPENILLDYTGHIALCDFGLCKLDMKDEDRTNSKIHSAELSEYLAPELLLGNGYSKTVDWWTLGVLLYEMLTGLPPFYDENTNEMYRKILQEPLTFPSSDIVPPAARDLLTRLLDRDPQRRLGANGAVEIKSHHFFANIDWRKLLQRKYEPSFRPNVLDARDTDNFDREFTEEAPQDSYVDGPALSSTVQQQFAGWSYNRPVAGLGDGGGSVKDPSFGSIPE